MVTLSPRREREWNAAAAVIRVILLLWIWRQWLTLASSFPVTAARAESGLHEPTPRPWPHQFHSILFVNYSGSLSLIDLWYDWPNGRNFNIIRGQLGDNILYDLEWNNGTTFLYTVDQDHPSSSYCRSSQLEVGILLPNWLDGATYLGQRTVDGFLCNVWEKLDFIWYYEDVVTKRPVHWLFYSGRSIHVMTFEVGAVLEDAKWQAPVYCFEKKDDKTVTRASVFDVDMLEHHLVIYS